jgi:alkylglycerol monooxygenase
MAKDCRHAESWLDKVKVWFARPGWRPADVAARFPKPAYDPHRDFVKYDPPATVSLNLYGFMQFVALMAANSHFLALLPKQSAAWSVAYFLFILVSLVCLGGVLESRREFMLLEALRLTATALAVLTLGTWFGGVRDARILASIVIFAVLSLGWLWIAARAKQETAAV